MKPLGRRRSVRSQGAQNGSPRRRQIALLVETSNAYARGLLEGISAYVREHRSWSVELAEHTRGGLEPAALAGWKGDGIIARVENLQIARVVRRCALPTVDLSAARLLPEIPWVETDNAAIARLAIEHLIERGFRSLGYFGLTGYNWSIWRRDHFVELANQFGCACAVHMMRGRIDSTKRWSGEHRKLAAWLTKLSKPVGILACFDTCGRHVLEACRIAGLRVPDDVAVVGVDNDPLLCELADPPLSSVAPDSRQTGYLAATLLDRMMAGSKVELTGHFVKPRGLVTRRSTDVTAIADPDISAAVQFIRDNALRGITVTDVLSKVALSRRVFEKRFAALVGRTPHQQIVRTQIERAKDLLAATDLPLKTIASRVGVAHAEYLNTLFRRAEGMTPGAYRRSRGASAKSADGKIT
jgi:LacI family transcriptional regulator, galactose operon repressor